MKPHSILTEEHQVAAVESATLSVNQFLERHTKKDHNRRGYSINPTVASGFAALCKKHNLVQSSVVEDLMRQWVFEMKTK